MEITEKSAAGKSLFGLGGLGCLGGLAVIAVLVLALGGWMISLNNQLVALQEGMKAQWAQIETVLQRRYDLIPNLVATVKGYAKHEQELLENVTKYRSQWGQAKTIDEKAAVAGQLEGAIARIRLVAENYPELKANQGFLDLQTQLEGTENRIAVERQRYNDSVRAYNTKVGQFPGNLIAGFRGFKPSDAYFESAPVAAEPPKVEF